MKQYLEAGKIVSVHGIRGEVKVLPWADSPEFLCGFARVQIGGRMYRVEQARVQKTCVLWKLQGIDTVESAQTLRDQVAYIDRDDAQLESGQYFIADLIGLRVLADGVEIGRVQDILPMPASDVYVVRGEHEYMIPGVKEFILETNPEAGYLRVKLLEGMQTDAD